MDKKEYFYVACDHYNIKYEFNNLRLNRAEFNFFLEEMCQFAKRFYLTGNIEIALHRNQKEECLYARFANPDINEQMQVRSGNIYQLTKKIEQALNTRSKSNYLTLLMNHKHIDVVQAS